MQTITVRITGDRNKTDGYMEILIGALAIGGLLLDHSDYVFTDDSPQTETVKVNIRVLEPPLGHTGRKP